jgi:dephospho-CoA kinase
MKWIGLTGGIASGKSTVAKILRDLGLPVVDADYLARLVTVPGSEGLLAVTKEFGSEILNEKGELDRSKLGQIVFSDEAKRLRLEKILHPLIQEQRAVERRALEKQGCELAFYDVPLLFEKNLESEFDATVLVYAPEELQRARLRERDNLSDTQIEGRLQAQLPIDAKLKRASYVIFNKQSISDLKLNVQTVLKELTEK